MIHLKPFVPSDDMRQYPWEALRQAVLRANNITVIPPLEMSQHSGGTVIGLNAGAAGAIISAAQNKFWQASMSANTTISSTDETAPSLIAFNTEDTDVIQGGIWTLGSSQLTIGKVGKYRFSVVLPVLFPSPSAANGEVAIWIERDNGAGGWVAVPNSGVVIEVTGSAAAQWHDTGTINRIVNVDDAESENVFRIVGIVTQNLLGNPDVLSNADTSINGVSAGKIAAVWNVEMCG